MANSSAIEIVNCLLQRCGISKKVESLKTCTPSLFVLLYEGLFDTVLPDLIRHSKLDNTEKLHNIKKVIERLEWTVGFPLEHINPISLVEGSERDITLLIQLFGELDSVKHYDGITRPVAPSPNFLDLSEISQWCDDVLQYCERGPTMMKTKLNDQSGPEKTTANVAAHVNNRRKREALIEQRVNMVKQYNRRSENRSKEMRWKKAVEQLKQETNALATRQESEARRSFQLMCKALTKQSRELMNFELVHQERELKQTTRAKEAQMQDIASFYVKQHKAFVEDFTQTSANLREMQKAHKQLLHKMEKEVDAENLRLIRHNMAKMRSKEEARWARSAANPENLLRGVYFDCMPVAG